MPQVPARAAAAAAAAAAAPWGERPCCRDGGYLAASLHPLAEAAVTAAAEKVVEMLVEMAAETAEIARAAQRPGMG